jgi:flagellar biosynthesis component FlhA
VQTTVSIALARSLNITFIKVLSSNPQDLLAFPTFLLVNKAIGCLWVFLMVEAMQVDKRHI